MSLTPEDKHWIAEQLESLKHILLMAFLHKEAPRAAMKIGQQSHDIAVTTESITKRIDEINQLLRG